MFTYPVLEGEDIGRTALVEDDVEDDHDQQGNVEGRNRCYRVKIPTKCDEHPGGKYQNPGYAAHGDSY